MALRTILILMALFASPLFGLCKGKIDFGPAFMSIDTLESGKKVRGQRLTGARISIDYLFYKNFLVRGTGLLGFGDATLQTYQGALGVCLPYKKLNFTPLVGLSYTQWKTSFDMPEIRVGTLEEHFWSLGPYLGLEFTWDFCERWRVGGSVQYIWSKTYSQLRPLFRSRDTSKGPSYSALLEYDLDDSWSINIGAAYNSSLTHEKHGIRGKGIKVGMCYWIPGDCESRR